MRCITHIHVSAYILCRVAFHNRSDWYESGFAVYFSYADLRRQGKLSSDTRQPWKVVVEDVFAVARMFRQVYITVWYPNKFGENKELDDSLRAINQPLKNDVDSPRPAKRIEDLHSSLSGYSSSSSRRDVKSGRIHPSADNPYLFTNIIQQVLPTRTGLSGIPSTTVVWLSSFNGSAPVRKYGPLLALDKGPSPLAVEQQKSLASERDGDDDGGSVHKVVLTEV
jgi:hypothetical protein